MNILILYDAERTYTNTVYEHLNSFARHSQNRFFFCHQDRNQALHIHLARFDAVMVHYSVRIALDEIADSTARALSRFQGLKALFIQDEYDNTRRAWQWIQQLGFQLVFTVVPPENIAHVYPPSEFPGVVFVNNLTGYVPDHRPDIESLEPPSARDIIVGYRGRSLPVRYGLLGREKIEIGRMVKEYCTARSISCDIAWTEKSRIYGTKWNDFIASCRAMLGSESGSNVFDWDGTLSEQIKALRRARRNASDNDIYRELIEPLEIPGLMNQISPRIFEAIAARTVLVLFEGRYSDILQPGRHYIPLRKDGGNLDEVISLLQDSRYIDEMADRTYREIIRSGEYSYGAFVRGVDECIVRNFKLLVKKRTVPPEDYESAAPGVQPVPLTTHPVRSLSRQEHTEQELTARIAFGLWELQPKKVRTFLRPRLKKLRSLL